MSFAEAGSGTAANAELVLKTLGVRDQVRPQYLGFSEAADAVRDGNLDVFAVNSGVPVPAITSLSASRKVRLIPLSGTELKSILALNPAFAPYMIKASSYGNGVVADAQTYGTPSTLMAQDGVPADVIYKIVKQIFTDKHKSYMKTVYKSWDPSPGTEAFKNAGVKHHPGALRAFKELGIK